MAASSPQVGRKKSKLMFDKVLGQKYPHKINKSNFL